ncbi:tryptophan 7-halogenase [Edaphobacter paludis]|uniref:Tryptophan 7-halogenase n=1 Tax=Edaphobacter paludis TaxID=3035702 RepID=A0AAU7DDG3_9BACT
MNPAYDIAVIGSGFAGSLTAMIARRLGHSVVLLEKDRHPRVVIGESSTPLSNLLLEDIATRYDLPRLNPLTKWGTWQEHYPNIACGLKRGFTFYHHQLGCPDAPDPDRMRQLLVAASPHNRIADTHWFRSDFDEMLVHEAQDIGVDYVDEVKLDSFLDQGNDVALAGKRNGLAITIRARFVVDATGPRGFLHRTLQLPEMPLPNYPSTQALFSHFSNVKRLGDAPEHAVTEITPYPIDDAAVHHVFEGGWIWVLRFNNGLTSAGVAATNEVFARLHLWEGETAWKELLESIPALQHQFATATRERPFTHAKRLSFLSETICGEKWALLPSAAGFVDPLLSTGFPLTLLGISRLADIFENDWAKPSFSARLTSYAKQTTNELLATSKLLSSLYANMHDFEVFTALSLLYFAAASFSETARRLNKSQLALSFLLHDHASFGPACSKLLDRAQHLQNKQESTQLIEDILCAIEPIDVAGLCNRQRRNWHPVDAEDLIRSAHKVKATRDEIAHLLKSCGFYE